MNSKVKFKSKKFYYFLFILVVFLSVLFSFSSNSFAAYPKLVSKIVNAFEKVEDYLVAIATPAAAVSIGCRFFNAKI